MRKQRVKFISEDDINDTIRTTLDSLPDTPLGYQLAMQYYNTDFFSGQDPRFVRKLARALNNKYIQWKNSLWISLSGNSYNEATRGF